MRTIRKGYSAIHAADQEKRCNYCRLSAVGCDFHTQNPHNVFITSSMWSIDMCDRWNLVHDSVDTAFCPLRKVDAPTYVWYKQHAPA